MEGLSNQAELFPLVIAQGEAFCNRKEEQALLNPAVRHSNFLYIFI